MTVVKKGRSVLALVLLIFSIAVAGIIGACSYKSHVRNLAFDAVQIGDTESSVIACFGTQPSIREKAGALFPRYASQPCGGECEERLWFENRLSLDTEAWSVDMDKNSRVIKKSHWISP